MMVREVEVSHNLVVAAQIPSKRLVIGDSGEENQSLSVEITRVSFREDCLRCIITD